mmetsp:Transcript_27191/g.43630  ORF Transcript_27191/g.43630 Transcript_27191/m.43630 type:complete len:225 (-) Transcript_27191:397-1071(-)
MRPINLTQASAWPSFFPKIATRTSFSFSSSGAFSSAASSSFASSSFTSSSPWASLASPAGSSLALKSGRTSAGSKGTGAPPSSSLNDTIALPSSVRSWNEASFHCSSPSLTSTASPYSYHGRVESLSVVKSKPLLSSLTPMLPERCNTCTRPICQLSPFRMSPLTLTSTFLPSLIHGTEGLDGIEVATGASTSGSRPSSMKKMTVEVSSPTFWSVWLFLPPTHC